MKLLVSGVVNDEQERAGLPRPARSALGTAIVFARALPPSLVLIILTSGGLLDWWRRRKKIAFLGGLTTWERA